MPNPMTYDYSAPRRNCDIVMKGGITSGVVYPHAVCEIAQTYRFKNIGGTSAGAIAAAATAAAEYGRAGGGFVRLAALPAWLGEDDHLLRLFQPQVRTRKLFRVVLASIGDKDWKWRRVLQAIAGNFWWSIVLGAVPGAVVIAIGLALTSSLARGVLFGAGLVVALFGMLVGPVLGIYRGITRDLAANGFGLCTGMGRKGSSIPVLTRWLADTIDNLAGVAGAGPLTFRHLRCGPEHVNPGSDCPPGEPYIGLALMTTNLTQGRPYQLPFESRVWYFDPIEFKRFFPEEIVDWMVSNPPTDEDADLDDPRSASDRAWELLERELLLPLRPLPATDKLPVVVAARMSLSFPVLICPIPLYAVDWSLKANQTAKSAWRTWRKSHADWPEMAMDPDGWQAIRNTVGQSPIATRNWFSDGGITSNFPIHFFDAPLPRWPTFGIDLRPYHPDHLPNCDACDPGQPACDQKQSLWMPKANGDGILEIVRPINAVPGLGPLIEFGRSIVETMQNWNDSMQMRAPGYRDRIVHVMHTGDEGGMNLNMPDCRIEALSERGRCAGEKLVRRFAGPKQAGIDLTWENHRWVRYRSALGQLQHLAITFRRALCGLPIKGDDLFPVAGDKTYQALIEGEAPHGYSITELEAAAAAGVTAAILSAAGEDSPPPVDLTTHAPRPAAELRARPKV